ncbi:MAG: orotidine-5'-phosphate decarboxylase [Rhodospirillales bacterium]|nr:orotidine-5'-phosphate decarboxylase [Rhodospirillales bacterium]
MDPSDRIFVALDTSDLDKALALAEGLRGLVGGVKLGQEFFTAQGPAGVDAVTALGLPVFLDLKFHDIPATVSRAVGAALALKLFMLNVHASGGEAMMWAAADAAGLAGDERPLVVAVTVLTSLWSGDLVATGIDDNIEDQVLRLAALAENCDLDGVVCSPREVAALRRERGPDFKLVVPGIRPTWAATDDQKRVETPADTVAAGADYLVIGRPITESQDPADAARRIADEIGK